MSAAGGPDGKPSGPAPSADGDKRSTVGVYDRPESADRPSMLPKIITAVIVVLMLVLTWMFWPRSAGAAAQASQAACSEQPADAAGASAQAPIGTGHAPLPAAPQHA